MAIDVEPISERWREIVEEKDESKQGRMLRKYVYELERQVGSETYELEELKRENKKLKKSIQDILKIACIKEEVDKQVKEAENRVSKIYNSDWSGLQGGF